MRVEAGIIRQRTERLMVGSRDCSSLVQGVLKQTDLVSSALDKAGINEVATRGTLCFVEADWPLIGGSFTTAGVDVMWPKKAVELLLKPGNIDDASVQYIYRTLAEAFPPA